MRKFLIALLVFSISCQTITQFSTQDNSVETPITTESPTILESIEDLGDPWITARIGCFNPEFSYSFDRADKDNIFRYFQGMWREAEIVINPEPQNLDELYDIALTTDLPLSSIHLSIDSSCVWITLPSEEEGKYYLLYRDKERALRKHLLDNDAILNILSGQWISENADTVTIKNQTMTVNAKCAETPVSLPLFTANSSVACFGSEEGYICTEYLGSRMIQISEFGDDIPNCLNRYFVR